MSRYENVFAACLEGFSSGRRVLLAEQHLVTKLSDLGPLHSKLARTTKTVHLKDKIATLKEDMQRLEKLEVRMLATPDRQISLTDPDARSIAASGRGSGMVGYNVQAAVDTKIHLIVAHEVTNVGSDRAQLYSMVKQTKAALETDRLDIVAPDPHARHIRKTTTVSTRPGPLTDIQWSSCIAQREGRVESVRHASCRVVSLPPGTCLLL